MARKLWMVPTLVKWYQGATSMEADDREKYAYTVPAVLEELLAAYSE